MTIKCFSLSSPILFHAPRATGENKTFSSSQLYGPLSPLPLPHSRGGGGRNVATSPLSFLFCHYRPPSLPSVQGVIFICHNPVIASPRSLLLFFKRRAFFVRAWKKPIGGGGGGEVGACEGDDGRYKKCPCEHGQGSKSGASLNQNPGVAIVFTPKTCVCIFSFEIGTSNDAHR